MLPGTPSPGNLVAATYTGSWEEAHRKILVPYFTKVTRAGTTLVPLLAVDQVARLTAAPNNPPFDVVILDEGPFNAAPKEEILQKYPVEFSKSYGDLLPSLQNTDEGWGPTVALQIIGIGYNTEKIKNPPTSWADLWNPEYKGGVGLVSLASTLGTGFMVQMARLRGGSEENIDAAFAAIRDLLPNVAAVAVNPGALQTLFQQGEIDIAPHYLNNIAPLKSKGVPVDWVIPKEGGIAVRPTMHVVKSPRATKELATAYIDAAISVEVQTRLASEPYYLLPTNKNVPISGVVAEKVAKDPAAVLEKLIVLDWTKINKNRTAWIEKFNREVRV